MSGRRWTRPELYVLQRLFASTPTQVLAQRLGRSYDSVAARAKAMGIAKDDAYREHVRSRLRVRSRAWLATHQFQRGHVPHNAGLKGWRRGGRSVRTQFKPGQTPANQVPIGTERMTRDGLYRKVSDTGKRRFDWRAVRELVWTQHEGPVPAGMLVTFRDGMATHDAPLITIDRLELVSRAQLMRRNSMHTRYPQEICQLMQLRGAVNRQIRQREQPR